ncbi:MAG TPA: mechanosensitive ion channel domain-containing protein, partial [Thermoanaerobaculia bacterium]|nr:mechanosensitive ion channel domain-containing protein [Thermoanaerobaculia bacterium]
MKERSLPPRARLYLPLLLTVLLFAAWFALRWAHMPKEAMTYVLFAAVASLIFFFVRFVDVIVFEFMAPRHRQVATPQLLRAIISLLLYVLFFAAAFQAILQIDVKGWLTGGVVVAAVVALALQDTLGNLFAGIALHMEQTFQIGDVIHSGDYRGRVESVSWRATRVRGYDNQLIVLPNSLMARERLEIFPRNNLNARILSVGIDYHAAPATVIGILSQVAAHVDGVSRELPAYARVGGFGDSAVNYEIKYYTRDYFGRDRIDADIRKAVWYALRRNNVSIPFPIRAYQPY